MSLYGPKDFKQYAYGAQEHNSDCRRYFLRRNTVIVLLRKSLVAETLIHIASLPHFDRFAHEEEHLSSLEGFDFEALIKRSESEEKRPRSKAEIIELLRTEGERWAQWVEQLPESLLSEQVRMGGGVSKNRFEMLIGTKEHEMQHRAQLNGH